MIPNWDISRELAHDVFTKIYERRYKLNPDCMKTRNYIYKAARHKAYDYIKKEIIEEEKLKQIYFEDVVFDKNFYEDIEDTYIEGEVISTLNDAINSFPDKKKDVFIEKIFHNKRDNEISRNTNVTVYFVKKIQKEISLELKKIIAGIENSSEAADEE